MNSLHKLSERLRSPRLIARKWKNLRARPSPVCIRRALLLLLLVLNGYRWVSKLRQPHEANPCDRQPWSKEGRNLAPIGPIAQRLQVEGWTKWALKTLHAQPGLDLIDCSFCRLGPSGAQQALSPQRPVVGFQIFGPQGPAFEWIHTTAAQAPACLTALTLSVEFTKHEMVRVHLQFN